MRKLVTIRTIKELNPIPGADMIEVATVDGWKLVVKKGEFKVGDPCVYFEIDSFLPEADPRYAFIMKSGVREFEGARGHKLRTVKLRGQISQGLALPVTAFPEIIETLGFNTEMPQEQIAAFREFHGLDLTAEVVQMVTCEIANLAPQIDIDFSELLGIKKWEPQLPAELAGLVKGYFPSWIRKTDQERCQNIVDEIFVDNMDEQYEVTIKLDGTSATFYHRDGEIGACSRNLELKICDDNATNTYVRILMDSGLNTVLPQLGNIAVQGEIMGPGIQNNREGLKAAKFFVFDVYLIDEARYMAPAERQALFDKLIDMGVNQNLVAHVPILAYEANLYDTLGIVDVDDLLKFAEGKSLVNPVREGLVFKRIDGGFSFKAISNLYLEKEKG